MTGTSLIHLAANDWAAEISPLGAELKVLRWRGRELLWNGDPAWWGRTAPLLFPVVGACKDGMIRVEGRAHPMPKHGFARDLAWTVARADPGEALFVLEATGATRGAYPFDFRLSLAFRLDQGLAMTARLENPGAAPLPASFGFHPAFRWPLDPAFPREAHRVRFEREEPSPLRRLSGDFLAPAPIPTPVKGRDLELRDELFIHDALVWDAPRSRGLAYGPPGGLTLRLEWDLPHLGIWTKPGAPFLCLEPWQGLADPEGFQGDFPEKPGVILVPPSGHKIWSCLISCAHPSE